jgi:hypothetical protein
VRIFARSHGDEEHDESEPLQPVASPLREPEFLDFLDFEMQRALRYTRPLAVVFIAPQLLDGEQLSSVERRLVAATLSISIRGTDRAGTLRDGGYAVVLPETGAPAAQAAARRLVAELTLKSSSIRHRKWLAGAVMYSGDAEADDFVRRAANAAAEARRVA